MPSLVDVLRTTAGRSPDHTALVFGDRSRTYREFADEVERMASVLFDRGTRKGDRVLLLAANSDIFVVAAYAILRAGAILVPVNPGSAPPELAYLLNDAEASVLIVAPAFAELARAGVADSEVNVLCLGAADGFTDLIELAASGTISPVAEWPAEADDALLIYTSGTTGRPKGALFDHHRSIWVGINMSAVCGLQEQEKILHVAPLYHAAELCMMLFPGMMTGATHTILPNFDPVLVANTMAEQGISIFFGVPTMYQWLLKVPGLGALDLSAWRVGMFGAAPMPASVIEQLIERLPSVALFQLCGQTEAGPGGIYSGPADVRARPDASGRLALPNTECRVVDIDDNEVQPGEVGELLLRGETVMKRYWNKPEETSAAIRNGWLHTGDVALLDADGYMTIVDRMKDMIISGGRNVYSIEVENALMGHPDIADVAVLGVPHAVFGESILAVIVPRDGTMPTLEDVRVWIRTQVSDYKVPHQILIHPIPRNPSGKIQKHVLRAELEVEGAMKLTIPRA